MHCKIILNTCVCFCLFQAEKAGVPLRSCSEHEGRPDFWSRSVQTRKFRIVESVAGMGDVASYALQSMQGEGVDVRRQ